MVEEVTEVMGVESYGLSSGTWTHEVSPLFAFPALVRSGIASLGRPSEAQARRAGLPLFSCERCLWGWCGDVALDADRQRWNVIDRYPAAQSLPGGLVPS